MPENPNWGADPWRAPELKDADALILCEHGRVIYRDNRGVDYRSHWYRVVQRDGFYHLLVKHGGGTESFEITFREGFPAIAIAKMDSDDRYLLLNALYRAYTRGRLDGHASAKKHQEEEIAAGTLKRCRPRRKRAEARA
jgi:hypothetical protein